MKSAAVIIVCSDAFQILKESFDSIINTSKLTKRLIIVDNCSQDQSMKEWLASINNSTINDILVQIIFNDKNEGFAAAVNKALNNVDEEVLVIIHSDTIFIGNSLDNLIESSLSDSNKNCVFSPITDLVTSSCFVGMFGRGQYNGVLDCSSHEKIKEWISDYILANKNETRDIFRLSSFAFAMRKELANKIISEFGSFFNLDYGIGPYEDVDLGRRILKVGGIMKVCLNSYASHIGKTTWILKKLDFEKNADEKEKIFRNLWDRKNNITAIVTVEDIKHLNSCLSKLSLYCDGAFIVDISNSKNKITSKLSKENKSFVKGIISGKKENLQNIKNSLRERAFALNPDWFIDVNSEEYFDDNFVDYLPKLTNPIDISISSYLMKTYYLCGKGDLYRADGKYDEKYSVKMYRAIKGLNFEKFNVQTMCFVNVRVKNVKYLGKKLENLPDPKLVKLKYWKETQNNPKISLVMIVKDEVDVLERCLKSAHGLYDELIVVWSGTNPATKQILERYNAKIILHKWNGDFAFARNKGLKFASCEWIFWLDADEFLPDGAVDQWKRILKESDEFVISAIKADLNKDLKERLLTYYPRAFRNFRGIKFKGKIHEVLAFSKFFSETAIQQKVFHEGYNDSELYEKKGRRNLKILKKEYKNSKNPKIYAYLIQHFFAQKKYNRAIKIFEYQKRQKILKRETRYKSMAYLLIAECYIKLNRLDDALMLACELLADNNLNSLPYRIMANVYLKKEQFYNAILALESIVKISSIGFKFDYAFNEDISFIIPLSQLILLYIKNGKFYEAKMHFDKLISLSSLYPSAKEYVKKYEQFLSQIRYFSNYDDSIILPTAEEEYLGNNALLVRGERFSPGDYSLPIPFRLNKIIFS